MNVYIENYGCSANLNNGELMAGILTKKGFVIVKEESMADIVILNTCVVKGPTLNRMISRIKTISKPLVVAGCIAEINDLTDISQFSTIGPRNVKDIVEVVKLTLEGKHIDAVNGKDIKLNLPRVMQNKIAGIIQISDGCLGNCTYCLPRLAKKNLCSYPREEIIKEVKRCVENGCKEIWLTSQDNGCYGQDINERLPALLKDIANIKGKFLVRIGMANPNFVKEYVNELVEILNDKKFFKFIHIPLQAGSDKVLKDMNRKYSAEDFVKLCQTLRAGVPGISIATDIIAGFPTETEEDFTKTMDVIKNTLPEIINVSRYWPMKLTSAYKLKPLDDEVIKKRIKELTEFYHSNCLEKNKALIGKNIEVIIDDGSKGNWLGRTKAYRQAVVKSNEKLFGKFLKAKIIDAGVHHLKVEIIN